MSLVGSVAGLDRLEDFFLLDVSLKRNQQKLSPLDFFYMNINLKLKIKMNKKRHSSGIKTLEDA